MSQSKILAPFFLTFSGLALEEEGIVLGDSAEKLWRELPPHSEWQEEESFWREDGEWVCKKYFDDTFHDYFFEAYKK
ncbi:MAG: hypothetical protein R3A80_00385 [Bdellovibrionota bacterium]